MITINNDGKIELKLSEGKILFVCTGNTCRSRMCEAVFNAYYADDKLTSESAGIFADGSPVSENAALALRDDGIEIDSGKKSRGISQEIIDSFSLVIAVTQRHAAMLTRMFPDYADRIVCMPRDISDPFGGDIVEYKKCLAEIKDGLAAVFVR